MTDATLPGHRPLDGRETILPGDAILFASGAKWTSTAIPYRTPAEVLPTFISAVIGIFRPIPAAPAPVKAEPPITLDDVYAAYVTGHPRPDALAEWRWLVTLPDGGRAHAPTRDEAIAKFNAAVRALRGTS